MSTSKCEGCEDYIPASRDPQARYCSPECRARAKARRKRRNRLADPVRGALLRARQAKNTARWYANIMANDPERYREMKRARYARVKEAGKKCFFCGNEIDLYHLDGTPYARCSKCTSRINAERTAKYASDPDWAARRREVSTAYYARCKDAGKCPDCSNEVDLFHLDGTPFAMCSDCHEMRNAKRREKYASDPDFAESRREMTRASRLRSKERAESLG